MIILFSIIYIGIAIWGYYKYRFLFNPITSMFLVWGVILPFSHRRFFEVINPSDTAYYVIFIGLMAYLAGTIIGGTKKSLKFFIGDQKVSNRANAEGYCIRYKLFYALAIVSLVYYLIQFAVVGRLLLSGYSYDYVRILATTKGESLLNSSAILVLLKTFIAIPTTYLAIAILPLEIAYFERRKSIIILSILLMFLFVLTSGGRSVILWMLLYLACTFLLYNKQTNRIKIKKKYKRIFVVVTIVLFFVLLSMTQSRKGHDVNLLKEVFIYFVVPISHFDHYIDVVNQSHLIGYGASSFYGFLYPFLFFLRLIGIFEEYPVFIQDIYYLSFEKMETGYYVGGGIYMNAFVTMFYQPYLDGRIVGVIIILALFGFVCSRFFVHAYYYGSKKALLLYLLLLQKIVFTFVRFYFTQQPQAICFILAFLMITSRGLLIKDAKRKN